MAGVARIWTYGCDGCRDDSGKLRADGWLNAVKQWQVGEAGQGVHQRGLATCDVKPTDNGTTQGARQIAYVQAMDMSLSRSVGEKILDAFGTRSPGGHPSEPTAGCWTGGSRLRMRPCFDCSLLYVSSRVYAQCGRESRVPMR